MKQQKMARRAKPVTRTASPPPTLSLERCLNITCPECGVFIGFPCKTSPTWIHPERRERARRALAAGWLSPEKPAVQP